MNMKIYLSLIILAVVLFAGGTYFYQTNSNKETVADKIQVTTPVPNALVRSPLIVSGKARGTWYFEASFPVKIFDANQKELGIVPATAKNDWQTTEFVPFEATLIFQTPTTETGTLVFQKDNPSGLPANDDFLSIPIRFEKIEKTGILSGEMIISPVCPVERSDNPCRPTAEMYAGYKILIYQFTDPERKNKILVSTLTPDAQGKFNATLPEGTYFVDMTPLTIEGVEGIPATIFLVANKTATLKIDIDTGIR